MKILKLSSAIMSTVFVLSVLALGFERPKVEIGLETKRTKIFVQSRGLTSWNDSEFYQLEMATEFDFEPGALFGPHIRIGYKRAIFNYNYFTDDFYGAQIQFTRHISPNGFRTLDNKTVYELGSDISVHEFSFDYELVKNIKSIIMYSRRKNIISASGDYTLIHIAGPLYTKSLANLFGLGANYGIDLRNDKLSFEAEYVYYPKVIVDYTYAEFDNFPDRNLNGAGYRWNALLILHFESFDISGGYEYFFMQDNSRLWKTKMNGMSIGIKIPIHIRITLDN